MQFPAAINSLTTENLFLLISFFLFGSIIGSFLNVVIHRLPLEESIVLPASHCPGCGQGIAFYDNVPVFSWLILGGRCRRCRQPISWRYPFVELVTGVLFAVVFWHTGLNWLLPFDCLFAAAMVTLIFIDAEHFYLPNVINYPGLVIALFARLILPFLSDAKLFDDLTHAPLENLAAPLWLTSLLGALLGAAAGGGFLWFVGFLWKRLRGIDAMGLGDVKMMLLVGAYLGWRLTVFAIFLAAFVGAVSGIVQISRQPERDLQTKIPFGIYLGIGSMLALLWGTQIIDWYLQTFY